MNVEAVNYRTERPTIVIISANAGSGHRKAGDALHASLLALKPNWHVRHENISEFVGPVWAWVIEHCWEFVSTAPAARYFYSRLYPLLVTSILARRFYGRILRAAARALEVKFGAANVQAVVTMHPAAGLAASQWRRYRPFSLHAVCTDLVVHGLHDVDLVDRIFCDRRATFLPTRDRGAFKGRLTFNGLPISASCDFSPAATSLHDRFDVLVTFGAKGLLAQRHVDLVLGCLKSKGLSAVIVCGSSPSLRNHVSRRIGELDLCGQVKAHGLLSDLSPLLRSARTIVGKPGGLTTGEALRNGLPFVIIDCLPGQEEFNRDALIREGLGWACDSDGFATSLDSALASSSACSKFARLESARLGAASIAATIVADLADELALVA